MLVGDSTSIERLSPKKTTRAHDTSHNDDLACHVEEAGIRVGTALPPARTISAT